MSVAHSPALVVLQGGPRRLSSEECATCIAGHQEGRLGYLGGRGHRQVVTRYVLSGDHITFRVPDYNDIAQYAPGASVSFVVEGASTTAEGYESVRISGRAELMESDVLSSTQKAHLDRWPPEVSTCVIQLPLTSISGVGEPPLPAPSLRQL